MPLKCALSKCVRRSLYRCELECEYPLPCSGEDLAQALAFPQSVLRGNPESASADATGMERA